MEECIASAGEHGKYQKIIIFIAITLGSLPFTLSISYAYLTKMPQFLCKDENGQFTVQCEFEKTKFCSSENNFEYIKDKKNSVDNFTYAFDLYCSKEFFVPILSTLFFFGGLLGSVFFATIPDKHGRKTIFLILQVLSLFLQINTLFAMNPWHLLFVYFFSGLATYGYGMSSIIVAEYLPRNVSNIIMSIENGSFPLGGIIIGIFFCLINNMKLLFIITVSIQAVTTYLSLKYFKESPIWLFSMKLKERFVQTMREIAIINEREAQFEDWYKNNKEYLNKVMSKNVKDKKNEVNEEEEDIKTYTIVEIFSFNSQRNNLIKTFVCWFMVGSIFYGIILNLAYAKGSFYITCFCSFAGEITGELSSGVLAGIIGRIKTLYSTCFISGIAMIIYTLLDSVLINYICIYLATLGIASSFNILFIYTPELYPTPIRGTICGYSYLLSRFGAMVVSPITTYFGAFTTNILFSCCSIASAIILSKMPETLGKELQNEIPEFEGTNALIDSTYSKLSSNKRYLLSEKLFKSSFIGHDPISIHQISSKSITQFANIGSGIFSRK